MEKLSPLASCVVLLRFLLDYLPRVAGWTRARVRPHYYPGSVLMKLHPVIRHPFSRQKREDFGFYLGFTWQDPNEASVIAE